MYVKAVLCSPDLEAGLEEAAPGAIPGSEGMGELGFVYRFQEYLARAILAIHECDKPVIAAVNGVAVGGGLALALASDLLQRLVGTGAASVAKALESVPLPPLFQRN